MGTLLNVRVRAVCAWKSGGLLRLFFGVVSTHILPGLGGENSVQMVETGGAYRPYPLNTQNICVLPR